MENNFDMLDENLKLLEKKLGKMYFETLNLEHFSSKGIQIISDCIYKIRKVKNANFEESDFELISKTLEKLFLFKVTSQNPNGVLNSSCFFKIFNGKFFSIKREKQFMFYTTNDI